MTRSIFLLVLCACPASSCPSHSFHHTPQIPQKTAVWRSRDDMLGTCNQLRQRESFLYALDAPPSSYVSLFQLLPVPWHPYNSDSQPQRVIEPSLSQPISQWMEQGGGSYLHLEFLEGPLSSFSNISSHSLDHVPLNPF